MKTVRWICDKMLWDKVPSIQSQPYTSVYCVLQSQKVATGYVNNKIEKEAVKIDIKCNHGYTKQ